MITSLEQPGKTEKRVIRVFIIEDYKLTRLGLRSILSADAGIEVVGEAEDGEKGVSLVRQLKPDVVLMDLGLPGISGIEATHQIKAFDDKIKIIVYTSHEREDEVIAALGAGANAYCLKDNAPSSLVETVKIVAEGAAWLDPAIANVALRIFQTPAAQAQAQKGAKTGGPQLTERELEVLKLLVEGKSNTEIAKELIISVHTAKAHVCNILQKLSVHDRVQAAVKAIKSGIV